MPCPNLKKLDDKPCINYIKGGTCARPDEFMCIEYLKTHLPLISHSAANDFAQCKMKYYLSKVRGIKLKPQYKSDALKMGSIWDSFLTGTPAELTMQLESNQLADVSRAKVYALMRAAVELIDLDYYGPSRYERQATEFYHNGDCVIKCIMDLKAPDHFAEIKLSSKPTNYLRIERITHQVGAYFLAHPAAEYCDMLVTQTPAQRYNESKESIEEYEQRVFSEIMADPAKYFCDYTNGLTYGRRFYRKEFNLDLVRKLYANLARDLHLTVKHNLWYTNDYACHNESGACDYYNIKNTGYINEMLYDFTNTLSQPTKPEPTKGEKA